MNDIDYMRLALQLAARGEGWTSPNPMVGAVIVKGGRIIGQGWHERYGALHAERNALRACTEDPAGATMYVTLEPCCHHGKCQGSHGRVTGQGLSPDPLRPIPSKHLLPMGSLFRFLCPIPAKPFQFLS